MDEGAEPRKESRGLEFKVAKRARGIGGIERRAAIRFERGAATVLEPIFDVLAATGLQLVQEVLVVATGKVGQAPRGHRLQLQAPEKRDDARTVRPSVEVVATSHEGGPPGCDPPQFIIEEARADQGRLEPDRHAVGIGERPHDPIVWDPRNQRILHWRQYRALD